MSKSTFAQRYLQPGAYNAHVSQQPMQNSKVFYRAPTTL